MKDVSYLAELVTIITGIIALIPVVFRVKKYFNKYVEKRKLKRNNIYIFIADRAEKRFSINYEKSTKIDYNDWSDKINKGGELFVECEWSKEIEKGLSDKNIDEKTSKEIKNAIRILDKHEDRIKSMLMIALLDDIISSKISCFPRVVDAIIDKYFSDYRENDSEDEKIVLAVYNHKNQHFNFEISKVEYLNVLDKSNGRIKIIHFVSFKEFITMLNDKTILESEIIPSYLMSTVKTVNSGVPIEDFMHWDISVA